MRATPRHLPRRGSPHTRSLSASGRRPVGRGTARRRRGGGRRGRRSGEAERHVAPLAGPAPPLDHMPRTKGVRTGTGGWARAEGGPAGDDVEGETNNAAGALEIGK